MHVCILFSSFMSNSFTSCYTANDTKQKYIEHFIHYLYEKFRDSSVLMISYIMMMHLYVFLSFQVCSFNHTHISNTQQKEWRLENTWYSNAILKIGSKRTKTCKTRKIIFWSFNVSQVKHRLKLNFHTEWIVYTKLIAFYLILLDIHRM